MVLVSRNRAQRLAALIESLRRQTIPPDEFEVIVVDDRSTDETPAVLARASEHSGLSLRYSRRANQGGPAAGRNDGWSDASAPLVAFIDDDCVATPQWLERLLDAADGDPGAVVQGRTEPNPDELANGSRIFAHTLAIHRLGPFYETCNILYPRELLGRLGGFDAEAFSEPVPGGEDTDLAWRAIEAGASTTFASQAVVYHAVSHLGPVGKLRHAWRWAQTVQVYRRHPGMRGHLTAGIFWKGSHYLLFRVLVAALLPKCLWPIRRWLALAYFTELPRRLRREGISPLGAPYVLLHDVVEFVAVARGAIRYRTLVL